MLGSKTLSTVRACGTCPERVSVQNTEEVDRTFPELLVKKVAQEIKVLFASGKDMLQGFSAQWKQWRLKPSLQPAKGEWL